MNVLLYVMTLLMLLSTLTYARVVNFRSLLGFQAGFVHYMGAIEHKIINHSSKEWYEKLVVGSHKGNPQERDRKAGSRLSLYLLINQKEREKSQEAYIKTRELTKLLMTYLYGETDFFKEMIAKRSNFLDDILNEIQHGAEQIPQEQKIINPAGLLNLNFADQELHLIFYKMMTGLPDGISEPPASSKKNLNVEETNLDTDDEIDASVESEEAHASAGYVSLMDYITVRPTTTLRVFLASRPLLLSIYGDEYIVNNVIEKRQELYRKLKSQDEGVDALKKELSKEFQNEFGVVGKASEFKVILDFSVTKTDPKKYEGA